MLSSGPAAPVRPLPQHDPTRPAVEGAARAQAAAPIPDTASADGEVAAVPRTDDTVSPPARGEEGELKSWLGELRPPPTTDPSPPESMNGDDKNAAPAIPTGLQQDPDAT